MTDRSIVLYLPTAVGAVGREGEELGVAVWYVHLEQRLEWLLM
jgi:hypothetical protein